VSYPSRAAPPGAGRGSEAHPPTLVLPIVCLITDRILAPRGAVVDAVTAAVDGGVNMVQLREKDLSTRDLLDLARAIRAAIGPSALLLINGRADIAFAVEADGVHLSSDGLSSNGARATLGSSAIIGRSIHSVDEAFACGREPINYLELGTIFTSRSHPGGDVIGTQAIEAAQGCDKPIVAVGGITSDNVKSVIAAGASGAAVISAILAPANVREAAQRFSDAAREAWERRSVAGRA